MRSSGCFETFCRAELSQENYFHAVLEATKSVSDKIRCKTGLSGDGGELAMKALSMGQSGMPFSGFQCALHGYGEERADRIDEPVRGACSARSATSQRMVQS